jgi:hypothetical protein
VEFSYQQILAEEHTVMRELRVTDVDGASLIVADDEGTEFRVTVDETSLRRLRHSRTPEDGPRVSPKDIQSHLRAGLSNEEISALTGASLDLIQRFETPVLAERNFIISSALSVPTQTTVETETGTFTSAFGTVITQRLHSLSAQSERWATWKEESGSWIVKLEFMADNIDHDARWSYEPRKRTLSAVNGDASTLSQKGDLSTGLIPKLRAVSNENSETIVVDYLSSSNDTQLIPEFTHEAEFEPEETRDHSPTADLLEALRKRRNDRDNTPAWLKDEVSAVSDSTPTIDNLTNGSQTIEFDATLNFTEPFDLTVSEDATVVSASDKKNDSKQVGKNVRPTMPSWDDIVFGTRSEDDPS